MDRLPETAAAANATIASQNNASTKLHDLATATKSEAVRDLKNEEVPFDERDQPAKHTAAAAVETVELFHPPAINWTPSNEEDMAEKLFPAEDAVVPSGGRAKATSEKKQAVAPTIRDSTSAVNSPTRATTSKTAPSTPASSNKENNNNTTTATTPKREYKKKRSWLSLSPGLRRLKSGNKNKDKKPLLEESNAVEAVMASPEREGPATKTTGDFIKESSTTKEAVVDATKDAIADVNDEIEDVVNVVADVVVQAEDAVGDLLELTELAPQNANNNNTSIAAPAFSEAIEQMNSPTAAGLKEELGVVAPTVKDQVAEQVENVLVDKMGEENSIAKDAEQDIFRKKNVPEGAKRKFPSAFDIANTVVTDLKGTAENEQDALQSALLSAVETAAATAVATAELALAENDVETVVTSGAKRAEFLVTAVAEGIANVKSAEERTLTRSISMDEDDYDCVALDQCLLDSAATAKPDAATLGGDELGDLTEKATNLTTSKSMSASETSTDSKDEHSKGSKKKKWWKAPLKSLSPKRNRNPSKIVTLGPEGGAAKASVDYEDESEALAAADIHREFLEATATNAADTEQRSSVTEGSKFAVFEKIKFETPVIIKEVPSPTRKSLKWDEIVAHSEIRDADMRVGKMLLSFQLFLGVIVGALFFSTTTSAVLLRNAACSPLSPWMGLSGTQETYSVFTALWWVPAHLNSGQAFNVVCGRERAHTKLEWMFEKETKTDKLYRMVVTDMDGNVLLQKKSLISASFSQEGVLVTNKKGKQEAFPAPWDL